MLVDYYKLYNKVKVRLQIVGCSEEQAENITSSLMLSQACGVESHGLRMLCDHIKKIQNGFYNLNSNIIIEEKTSSFAKINCNGMVGMDSAVKCMQLAIDECKKNGLYIVFAHNANTLSAAFVYSLMAAKQGLIGIVASNSPAKMPAYGGIEKMLGTNPLSYAIPGQSHNPILFDMATSIVAQSKINMAKDRDEAIPEGWALNEHGYPTTNALDACKGMILPMAGPKGYGLSMMIDLIAGLLSGSAYLNKVGRFYNEENVCMNVGHFFMTINPVIIYGSGFYTAVDDYIDTIKLSKTLDNNTIRVPGENKFCKWERTIRNGVFIQDDLLTKLKGCCIDLSDTLL